MSWRLLNDRGSDVYRNLAIDEALAKTFMQSENTLNTLRFWESEKAVVIGRFQCVHKEVNLEFCESNDISIARRFTGGGAVFHDLGNLNYALRLHQSHSYVPRGLKELYETFIGAIAKSLNCLNIPAHYDPVDSSIKIGKKKISGTAGWIKQGISFIHGTLLIDANLEILQESLTPPKGQPVFLRDKTRIRCMDSKRAIVTNIAHELKDCPTRDEILQAIIETFTEFAGTSIEEGVLTKAEADTSQTLYQTLYTQPSWNMGTLAHD
ncbi:lipoate--protein ligase family protein [Candidatus Thorarchaeota archaeon]|nr:MAG: lipoate--protein ligase family protein [Candidatus Thorarchaeota archaeon]